MSKNVSPVNLLSAFSIFMGKKNGGFGRFVSWLSMLKNIVFRIARAYRRIICYEWTPKNPDAKIIFCDSS
ncbi:hypothetical protein PT276_06485 [Orbaceae bacterium ESL0721]|nr:hypothetical protein [Orbaceae bacterium ESL0721]